MKKVLFYIDHKNRGGAQRVMVELANFFQQSGMYEVLFVTQKKSEPTAYKLKPEVKEILLLDKEDGNFLAKQADRVKRLVKLCRNEKPDIIISFLIIANIVALIAGRIAKIPVLISVRNDPTHDRSGSFVFRSLMKLTYPWASGWVFQTKDAMSYYDGWIHGPASIIMNPLSEEVLGAVKRCSDRAADPNLIVAVGRLDPQKRHDLLLKAFAGVHRENRASRLIIYGEGALRGELEQMVRDLGLEEAVRMPGVCADIIERIRDARVFVMSSDYEGMPNALLEAMAAGLPVISTDCPCGGPAMLIENGKNGLLVPVDDADAMRKAIVRVLNDDTLAQMMGNHAAEITGRCRIETVAAQWKTVIDDVLK